MRFCEWSVLCCTVMCPPERPGGITNTELVKNNGFSEENGLDGSG